MKYIATFNGVEFNINSREDIDKNIESSYNFRRSHIHTTVETEYENAKEYTIWDDLKKPEAVLNL